MSTTKTVDVEAEDSLIFSDFSKARDSSLSEKVLSIIKQRFYIINWLPQYDRSKAIADLIAGITLGLTIIPQSLAYANLAGVPAVYGLYSAFMGSIIYVFFGTVKEVSIGPTSLMSLIILQYTYQKPIQYIIIMSFVCGIIEFMMGVFRLGFIIDFIPAPVIAAFSTATPIVIIGSQLKGLLGIKMSAKSFPDTVVTIVQRIQQTQIGDLSVGVFGIAFLLILRKIKDIDSANPVVKKLLWYLSISRNALVVIISSFCAYLLSTRYEKVPFALTEKVAAGIPSFAFPEFSVKSGNETIGFFDICGEMGEGLFLIALVAVMANVAIAKSFTSGKIVDASQEMIALGMANFLGSFFKSIPTCGAFTRSAVAHASSVQTPLSGVYSAIMTLLSLTLLTPYFNYIPKSTLAAVLICAVVFMIDFSIVPRLWHVGKMDFVSWLGCMFVCMTVSISFGLVFGTILGSISIFRKAARPKTLIYFEKIGQQQYIVVKPSSGITFPCIDYIREQVNSALIKTDFKYPIIIDCSKIATLDYTALKGFDALVKDLKHSGQTLIFLDLESRFQKKFDAIESEIEFKRRETLKIELISKDVK